MNLRVIYIYCNEIRLSRWVGLWEWPALVVTDISTTCVTVTRQRQVMQRITFTSRLSKQKSPQTKVLLTMPLTLTIWFHHGTLYLERLLCFAIDLDAKFRVWTHLPFLFILRRDTRWRWFITVIESRPSISLQNNYTIKLYILT